jgi:hypothetical protein
MFQAICQLPQETPTNPKMFDSPLFVILPHFFFKNQVIDLALT